MNHVLASPDFRIPLRTVLAGPVPMDVNHGRDTSASASARSGSSYTLSARRKRALVSSPTTSSTEVAKNRRKAPKVSRACDLCKLKKAKCSGTLPCSACSKKGKNCVFAADYKRGRPPTPPPGTVGIDGQRSPLCSPPNEQPYRRMEPDHISAIPLDTAPSRASPEMGIAEIGGQYFDPTCGLTFLHRAWKRLSAPRRETLPELALGLETNQRLVSAGDTPLCTDMKNTLAIPDKCTATDLMAFYFNVCVVTYRLLHRQTVMAWFEAVLNNFENGVTISHGIGNAKAAVVLTILAISTLRQEKLRSSSDHADWSVKSSDQLLNASTSLTETEKGLPRLESAQARLLQVIYLLQTTRMNHAWYVLGHTVQILSALGLHRNSGRKRNGTLPRSASPDYIKEQCRKRTFWAAYIIDVYLSVVLGRPRYYHDDDIDQDFPDLVNDDDMTSQGPSSSEPLEDCHVEALIFHAKLSQIISRTSKEVYSIRQISKEERITAASRLGEDLRVWRTSLPPHLSTVRPATLMPSFRRQTAALKLAHSHAIMHANRPFLLGHTCNQSETAALSDSVAECLSAAKVALETVDRMAQDGTLFHAFWWTCYVVFCALAVVYVWEIQQRSRSPDTVHTSADPSLAKLFDLAERCHSHLARATTEDSPNRRYSIILEELRLEAKHLSSRRGLDAPLEALGRGSMQPAGMRSEAETRPDAVGGTESMGLDSAFSVQEGADFEMIQNPLEAWEATDWLDLDSSAFGPFLDFNGSPVYSF